MVSPEAIVNCSNDSDELKSALVRINRELKNLQREKAYDKSYEDYIEYTYLQKLKHKAIIKQNKLHNPHF